MDDNSIEMGDTPYVEHPDEKDDHVRNGLICFLNNERECGADCMAFTTRPAESEIYNDQQRNCMALVALERTGRYLGTLVKLTRDFIRNTQAAPQPPTGPPKVG